MSSTDGSGSGGDRCTEADGAIIDFAYQIGPWTRDGSHTTRDVMFQFTEMLNAGSTVSAPEDLYSWFGQWLQQNTGGAISLGNVNNPSFADLVIVIERQHIAVARFTNYINLTLADGAKPYPWTDPQGLGHVVMVVGYDSSNQTIAVHDSLLAESRQPSWYSWQGFQDAGFANLYEVNGPALPVVEGSMTPDGWTDDGTILTAPNGIKINTGMRDYILNKYPQWIGAWPRENVPLGPEYQCDVVDTSQPDLGGGTRIDFLYWSLIWSRSKNAIGLARVGSEMAALKVQPAAPDASALQQAQSQLAAEQQQVVKLTAQVQQLQALLQQAPGTVPPGANEAIAAMKAIGAALAAINTPVAASGGASVTKPLPTVQ